jgi:hypothetical protein
MPQKRDEAMQCRIVGRLGREPEASTTLGGATVCRMIVVKRAPGPASRSTRVGLYLTGELAKRCRSKLHEGDLIEALGDLAERRGPSKARPSYPEVLVADDPSRVRLFERAGATA